MSEKVYKTTKEECQQRIKGVCEGCGGELEPIETVDNSNDPTYWVGCRHCSCFRGGVEEKYFKVARQLVEQGILLPYSHLSKYDHEDSPEKLSYYYDTQTAGLSSIIAGIDRMLKTL
uniref:Uncharacterized protein n=1 Tax=viral metagenome TaxID=1070528 RepID=A0A6H1ZS13_9ZZZZ